MGALPEGEPPFGRMAKRPSHLWRFGHLLITFFLKCPSMPPSFTQGSPGSVAVFFRRGLVSRPGSCGLAFLPASSKPSLVSAGPPGQPAASLTGSPSVMGFTANPLVGSWGVLSVCRVLGWGTPLCYHLLTR